MTKISIKEKKEVDFKLNRNVYVYGMYFDEAGIHKKEPNWKGIIIYVNPKLEENKAISSLEGFFVSQDSLLSDFRDSLDIGNPVIKRDEMEKFEKRYSGRFFPFDTK
jgi:hypothetical protein